jgi:L-serine dehydratase
LLYTSALSLYRIGPGPSSSHTVAPQRAALRFVHELAADGAVGQTARVDVHLYGALACTGRDLLTDRAIMAGLAGDAVERSDADAFAARVQRISRDGQMELGGRHPVPFVPERNVRFHVSRAIGNDGNALRLDAFDANGRQLASRVYYCSTAGEVQSDGDLAREPAPQRIPYAFQSAAELLSIGRERGKKITEIARANENALHSPAEVRTGILRVAAAMRASVERGLTTHGNLPLSGTLRRAPGQAATLDQVQATPAQRCAVFALAVGEENAAGGRVVSAPTNGSAGPVAALLEHWRSTTVSLSTDEGQIDFLLVAAAIGGLLRDAGLRQAGCQSAIGIAAAMAAAGFTAVYGGTNAQVLLAAERALEPHLGLTCDPNAGAIEQPCIDRGAAAAVRAVTSALAAVHRPEPPLRLDQLVDAMIETGRGMAGRYKKASLAGVALNVPDC